jgi:hypothetical protein
MRVPIIEMRITMVGFTSVDMNREIINIPRRRYQVLKRSSLISML